MRTLSRRQSQVLELINSFTESHGHAPSYRELMQALNLTSPASVHRHIHSLKKLGHLKETPRSWRNLKLAKSAKPSQSDAPIKIAIIGKVSKGQKTELFAKTALIEVAESLVVTTENSLYGFVVSDSSFEEHHMQQGDLLIVEARTEVKEGELIVTTSKQEGTQIKRQHDLKGATIQGVIVALFRKYAQEIRS